jgi:hypothetical protein
MPRCRLCQGWWSDGDRDQPAYPCDCTEEQLAERDAIDTREAGDDDGQEYADPRDEMERRLLELPR